MHTKYGKRSRVPAKISNVLEESIVSNLYGKNSDIYKIISNWNSVVDEEFKGSIYPIKVENIRGKKILYVKLNQLGMSRLIYIKNNIINMIKSFLGVSISDIKICSYF